MRKCRRDSSHFDVDMTVGDLPLDINGLFQKRNQRVSGLLLDIKAFPHNRGVDLLTRRLAASVQGLLYGRGNCGHSFGPNE